MASFKYKISNTISLSAGIITISLICGCATTTAPIVQSAPGYQIPHNAEKNSVSHNILPLLKIQNYHSNEKNSNYAGAYTRLYITNSNQPIGNMADTSEQSSYQLCQKDNLNDRCYSEESRNFFDKMFRDKDVSRILNVKISLKNPNVETTTTIASSTYSETKKTQGESWNTEVNGHLQLTPYFRIDGNSSLRIETKVNATSVSQSQISSKALSLVQTGIGLLTPASTLITAFNTNNITQGSQFLDNAINNLFTSQLSESSSNDFASNDWFNTPNLSTIHVWFPELHNITSKKINLIGKWDIKVEPPIISIFNPVKVEPIQHTASLKLLDQAAINAFAEINPNQILNFQISAEMTLRKFLQAEEPVATAIKQFDQANGNMTAAAYSLCMKIDEQAQALGLNKYDTAALIWAYSYDGVIESSKGQALRNSLCFPAQLAKQIIHQTQ